MKHIRRFLEEGDKVRITVRFRGREMAHTERGLDQLNRLAVMLTDVAKIEAPAKLEGRQMAMVLAPMKKVHDKAHEKVLDKPHDKAQEKVEKEKGKEHA